METKMNVSFTIEEYDDVLYCMVSAIQDLLTDAINEESNIKYRIGKKFFETFNKMTIIDEGWDIEEQISDIRKLMKECEELFKE